MDRYGYDTHDSHAYCIIDRKKNTHIATAFHVTTADKIVKALNDMQENIEVGKRIAGEIEKTQEIIQHVHDTLLKR